MWGSSFGPWISLREAAWEGDRPWARDEDRRDAVSCADRSEKVDVTDYRRKLACLQLLPDAGFYESQNSEGGSTVPVTMTEL